MKVAFLKAGNKKITVTHYRHGCIFICSIYLQYISFREVAVIALISFLLFFPYNLLLSRPIQFESRHPSKYVILRKKDSSHL